MAIDKIESRVTPGNIKPSSGGVAISGSVHTYVQTITITTTIIIIIIIIQGTFHIFIVLLFDSNNNNNIMID